MPSPTAASLGKYVDAPVSHNTGIPSIGVPIHSLSSGPLSVSISLNYHASGIKVSEPASRVGMGWSLSLGGLITRVVQGIPDEEPSSVPDNPGLQAGWYYSGWDLDFGVDDHQSRHADREILQALDGDRDTEPDIFTFNFAGYTGKFAFESIAQGNKKKRPFQNRI
jgi:hypothetical protein